MIVVMIAVYVFINVFAAALCKAAGKAEPKRCIGNEK